MTDCDEIARKISKTLSETQIELIRGARLPEGKIGLYWTPRTRAALSKKGLLSGDRLTSRGFMVRELLVARDPR